MKRVKGSGKRNGRADLMPFGEFLRRSGIGRTAGYAAVAKGTLPVTPIRVGRRLFVARREYERLIGEQAPVSDAHD